MGAIKAWKAGAAGEPQFPKDYQVLKKQVLQLTDLQKNNNKYYCIELHQGEGDGGGPGFRVFTHYGRTGDLDGNPDAGVRESRYLLSLGEAEAQYEKIVRQKTSPRKGYQEVNLASSKIGSLRGRGQSAGHVDEKTLERLNANTQKAGAKSKPKPKKSQLPQVVQDLVGWIYDEAKNALTSTINAKITANGIETPLGVLTVGQVERGEEILGAAYQVFKSKKAKAAKRAELERLSGQFYTVIPHNLGRSRAAIAAAILDSLPAFEQKQETLQLMKDMLQVNGDENVLLDPEVDKKYAALNCELRALDPEQEDYAEIRDHVLSSQIKHERIKIQAIYAVRRPGEWDEFRKDLSNQRLLFHGSRIQNWMGILSRGLLLPKIVVSLGVNRTDPGWLGHGLYFGDTACTSAFYTTPGRKRRSRLMALHRVALGKMKPYHKITFGLTAPPEGFDSCHGVRNQKGVTSEFQDDEFVVYDGRQQRQEYLVEFTL